MGPENGVKKNKWIFPALIWGVIITVVIVALKSSGFFSGIADDFQNSKMASLTSSGAKYSMECTGDAYDGYAIMRSKKFKSNLRGADTNVIFNDDNGDYAARVKQLVNGNIDCAVMPIHDYLEQLSYLRDIDISKAPVIVGGISLSSGSDAVMAHPDNFASINDLKGIKQINACYTSRFMLGSMAVDASLPVLLKAKANGDIGETFDNLTSGRCKVAGLWEPYISRAKKQGFKVLMGSDELKLARIVDVIIVNRKKILDDEDAVVNMLTSYYEAVEHYNDRPDDLYEEIELSEDGSDARSKVEISENLAGVHFYDLSDNSYTLMKTNSSSDQKLLDYIDAIIIKLLKMNAIDKSPLPNGDARSIVFNESLTDVFNSYENVARPSVGEKVYKQLEDKTWRKLVQKPKFTRDDLKITFLRQGTLDSNAKQVLDDFASQQINNFDYYIAIVGKTAKIRGVAQDELQTRTQKKSDRVTKYLTRNYQIDPNRIKSIGVGSSMTPSKKAGESYRNYVNDNNTVEILFIDY